MIESEDKCLQLVVGKFYELPMIAAATHNHYRPGALFHTGPALFLSLCKIEYGIDIAYDGSWCLIRDTRYDQVCSWL